MRTQPAARFTRANVPQTHLPQARFEIGPAAEGQRIAIWGPRRWRAPDGKEIAWSSLDGVLHFSDAATRKEQRRWKEDKKEVWNFAFSPHGKRLASSSDEGTIRLWDVAKGKSSRVLSENPQESGQPLAFSPDGAWVATGHPDGTIHLWDVESGEEKRRWQAGMAPVVARLLPSGEKARLIG
jgi:WD40 repeat protein